MKPSFDINAADLRVSASRYWYGYGRWNAPYWLVGMEPGGSGDDYSYLAWSELDPDQQGLIDCRVHHLWKRDNLGIHDPKWTRWHDDRPGRRTQPTWRRLIQLLLSFKGEEAHLDSVYHYQKYCLGTLRGETAVVELGALHAPGLRTEIDRSSFREHRISNLHTRLVENEPILVVCYGYIFSEQFTKVVGGSFNDVGFLWLDRTLCFLAPGPTSFRKSEPFPWQRPQWWLDTGHVIRELVEERALRESSYREWIAARADLHR
jgi:hypothetical protein